MKTEQTEHKQQQAKAKPTTKSVKATKSQAKLAPETAEQTRAQAHKPRRFEASTYSKQDITELIPLGVLPEADSVLLVGKKGDMKSQAIYHLVACVTAGKEFAEEVVPLKKGRAIVFNSERSISKVVRPRLEAATAVLTKVQVVPWRDCKTLDAALEFIKREVEEDKKRNKEPDQQLQLVAFDVVTDYKKATASDVREAVMPISDYCEQHSITVVFVLHLLHKGVSEKTLLGMISGSQAWTQVCSTILAVAMVDATPDLMLPQRPWFKGVKKVGVFEVAHTNLGEENQRWWYKWEGAKVEGLTKLQSSLTTGDVAGMSVINALRIATRRMERRQTNRRAVKPSSGSPSGLARSLLLPPRSWRRAPWKGSGCGRLVHLPT